MISVVVPCYNLADYIGPCIESLLKQAPEVEIIVVDDGSTDRSWEVIKSYGTKITAFRIPNQGVSCARNVGLAHAHSAFVSFVDGDDLWEEGFSAAACEKITLADPDWVVASCRELRAGRLSNPQIVQEPSLADPVKSLLEKGWGVPAQFVIRTQLVRDAQGFDATLRANEDLDLWLKLAERKPEIVLCPGSVAIYRVVDGSSSTQFQRLWSTREEVWRRYASSFDEPMRSRLRTRHRSNFYHHVMKPRLTSRGALVSLLKACLACPELAVTVFTDTLRSQLVYLKVVGGRARARIANQFHRGASI